MVCDPSTGWPFQELLSSWPLETPLFTSLLPLPCGYQCQLKGSWAPELSPWHEPLSQSLCCSLPSMSLLSLTLSAPDRPSVNIWPGPACSTAPCCGRGQGRCCPRSCSIPMHWCCCQQPPQEQRGAVLALPGNDQICWWPKYNYESWLGAAPFQAS